MTDRQIKALRLYLSGKTQTEIARIMGLKSRSAVSRLISRATGGIRKQRKKVTRHRIYKYSEDIDLYTKKQF